MLRYLGMFLLQNDIDQSYLLVETVLLRRFVDSLPVRAAVIIFFFLKSWKEVKIHKKKRLNRGCLNEDFPVWWCK